MALAISGDMTTSETQGCKEPYCDTKIMGITELLKRVGEAGKGHTQMKSLTHSKSLDRMSRYRKLR